MQLARSSFAAALLLAAPAVASAQGARFGAAVAVADVDGDGFHDVIVGQPEYDGASPDEGRVLVYRGSASGPEATPSWTRTGLQARARLGATVAALGDVNADGYDDVAVGAPDFDVRVRRARIDSGASSALRDAGLVAVFLGSPAGLGATPALFQPGIQQEEHVGAALARAGDVNGDGFDDVLVGASGTNGGRGAALVFAGSASGVQPLPIWLKTGVVPNGRFASSLAGGGDVDGDGFDDVLVGAPDDPPFGRGVTYLYLGSGAGPSTTHDWAFSAPGTDDPEWDNGISDWGTGVCLVDVNGDTVEDVVVTNPTYDADGGHGSGVIFDSGSTRALRGNVGGLPSFVDRADVDSAACFSAGDLDADGREEVFFALDAGPFSSGRLVYGHAMNWISGSRIAVSGRVAAAGDVDGDGFQDLACGDPAAFAPTQDVGQVRVYRGSSADVSLASSWLISAPRPERRDGARALARGREGVAQAARARRPRRARDRRRARGGLRLRRRARGGVRTQRPRHGAARVRRGAGRRDARRRCARAAADAAPRRRLDAHGDGLLHAAGARTLRRARRRAPRARRRVLVGVRPRERILALTRGAEGAARARRLARTHARRAARAGHDARARAGVPVARRAGPRDGGEGRRRAREVRARRAPRLRVPARRSRVARVVWSREVASAEFERAGAGVLDLARPALERGGFEIPLDPDGTARGRYSVRLEDGAWRIDEVVSAR